MCTFWTSCRHVCEPNISWNMLEKEFCEFTLQLLESLQIQYFTVCMNPGCEFSCGFVSTSSMLCANVIIRSEYLTFH